MASVCTVGGGQGWQKLMFLMHIEQWRLVIKNLGGAGVPTDFPA